MTLIDMYERNSEVHIEIVFVKHDEKDRYVNLISVNPYGGKENSEKR